LLWLYQRVFFGPVTNPKNEKLIDLTPRELATFVPLVILAFWMGIYPKPFFQILDKPVQELVQHIDTAKRNFDAGLSPMAVPGVPATRAPVTETPKAPESSAPTHGTATPVTAPVTTVAVAQGSHK
jgi:NADH-quinone oxidoreductase subunit M